MQTVPMTTAKARALARMRPSILNRAMPPSITPAPWNPTDLERRPGETEAAYQWRLVEIEWRLPSVQAEFEHDKRRFVAYHQARINRLVKP